jgi:uncharacterized protein (DUF2062 family)
MRSPHLSSNTLDHPPHWRTVRRRGWRRRLRYLYYRFIRLRGSSEAIARGLAVGVFAGCFPLFGLQTLIGITLAAIFRGNKLVAAAGTWVSNPLTYVPLYAFNLHIGRHILGLELELPESLSLDSWDAFVDASGDMLASLFVGSLALGAIAVPVSYALGLWLIRHLRRLRHSHRHRH